MSRPSDVLDASEADHLRAMLDWFRTLFRGEPLKTLFSTADWRDADLLRQAIDGTKGV